MRQLKSFNPATGALVGEVPVTPEAQVAEVVRRARAAQPGWAGLGLERRLELLASAGPAFLERAEALASLLTAEMGKPAKEALSEVRSVGHMDAQLREMREAFADAERSERGVTTVTVRAPLGVVAAITPWNFPISMPQWMCLPALAAGNTVVLKPSELTPLIAQAYVDLFAEVLPEGVLQIVHGDEVQGKALVASEVDMVAFTGSASAGKHILASAVPSLKRVLLELGGKDPLVVLDSADVRKAARFAAHNSFRNCGQVCVSTERIYVAAPLYDRFMDELLAAAADMPVGDGADPNTRIGPMISPAQKAGVIRQVRQALEQGAQAPLLAPQLDTDDQFLGPIVLTGVNHDMEVMRSETFGPVVGVMPFADEAEAIRLANDTPFGLGAVVFGAPDSAQRVARQLDAGMIGINRGLFGVPGSPWVGAKQSGYGYHHGVEGHRQFTQLRTLTF